MGRRRLIPAEIKWGLHKAQVLWTPTDCRPVGLFLFLLDGLFQSLSESAIDRDNLEEQDRLSQVGVAIKSYDKPSNGRCSEMFRHR